MAPHGVIPFLNPTTAASQVQMNCAPMPMNGKPPTSPATTPSAANDSQLCSVPIGGYYLWEFSNELRSALQGPLSGALFCDMGNAGFDFHFDYWHLSCGVGVRYDTPVGPIRLDVGYRIPMLQILGAKSEAEAFHRDPTIGVQPSLFGGADAGSGIPIVIAVGIGEAY